jgi:two-component system chemotaxis response regulator CheB
MRKVVSPQKVQLKAGECLFVFLGETQNEIYVATESDDLRSEIEKISNSRKSEKINLKIIVQADSKSKVEKRVPKISGEISWVAIPEGSLLNLFPKEGRVRVAENISTISKESTNFTDRVQAPSLISVMIVDDSSTIRKVLEKVFAEDPQFKIIGSFGDPREAEKEVVRLKPDVVTLDIHMPEMNGIEWLTRVMPKHPVPVVMVTSVTLEEGPLVFRALELGAVDYIKKPDFKDLHQAAQDIRERVRVASRAKICRVQTKSQTSRVFAGIEESGLIAIGSSTGGTLALKDVFSGFPEKIPPVLVVQHIPPVFSRSFADQMNKLFPFTVKEAEQGESVKSNFVYIAPGGQQMGVEGRGLNLKITLEDAAPVNRHKPSVDFLLNSLAALKERPQIAAAILTGMGDDGARGLLKLKELGVSTVAQNEATCVVFGMPRQAIAMGAVDKVAPLDEIARTLIHFLESKPRKKAA